MSISRVSLSYKLMDFGVRTKIPIETILKAKLENPTRGKSWQALNLRHRKQLKFCPLGSENSLKMSRPPHPPCFTTALIHLDSVIKPLNIEQQQQQLPSCVRPYQ